MNTGSESFGGMQSNDFRFCILVFSKSSGSCAVLINEYDQTESKKKTARNDGK